MFEKRGNQLFLVPEVPEEGDLVDIGHLGDLAGGGAMEPALGADVKRSLEETLAGRVQEFSLHVSAYLHSSPVPGPSATVFSPKGSFTFALP